MTAVQELRLPRMFAGRRARLLMLLIGIGVLRALSAVSTVLLVRHVFDVFLHHHSTGDERLLPPALALGAVAVLDGWLRMMEQVRSEDLGQSYVLSVRRMLFAHLVRVSPRTLRTQSRGGMLLRFLGDLTPLRQWLSLGVARIVIVCIIVPIALGALAFLSWKLAACVSGVLTAGALVSLSRGPAVERATREARRLRGHLATNVSEKLASAAVVQVFHQRRIESRRLERQGRRLRAAMITRARSLGGLRAWARITSGCATLGVLVIGVNLVAAGGGATPGLVVAAMTLTGLIKPELDDLARVFGYWQGARISREKLGGFLALPPLQGGGGTLVRRRRGRGRVRFVDAGVKGVFEGIHAVARPGRLTVLFGPNGAGKSTLLALAAGLIDPDQGRVLLDGKDIRSLRRRSLRRAIGMAGPDLPLLRGTLRRNLRYRWPAATQEELERVCTLCGVDEILAELPRGLDTRISEGGSGLSVGERQRIALARALLGTPDVLLLDEVDGNLDQRSRAALERVLAHYPGTVLLATHDADLARAADAVWKLENGKLVENDAAAVTG